MATAEPIARKSAIKPAAALLKEAARHQRHGAPDMAAATYRELLAAYPKNAKAAKALGTLTADRPTLPKGLTDQDQRDLDALSMANTQGDSQSVVRLGGRLVARYPGSALLRVIYGVALGKTGAGRAAISQLEVGEALRPDFADAAYNLGVVYQDLDMRGEAVAAYGRALKEDPEKADAWNNIGAIMKLAEDIPAAHQAFDRAVAINPGLVEALNNRGHMRQLLGDIVGAISDYQEALRLNPAHVKVYFNIAHALKLIGEGDAARTCLWEVLKLNPKEPTATRELARIVKGDDIARLWPHVNGLLQAAEPPETRMHGGYAAAYLSFSENDDAAGMAHLETAGGIARALKSYRSANDEALFATIRAAFEQVPDLGLAASDDGPVPIFIVGMPRSGTSLMEEILARHSDVSGGGELEYLNRAVNLSAVFEQGLTTEALERIRAPYLQALATHQRSGTGFVTDKMPINFRFLGLIALAFPEARIVHMRRAPEAVCWSNYQIFFPADGMAFTSTQSDIAAYYRLYHDLMAFWEDRFGDRIVHVDYAALTEDPEATTARTIAALGLTAQSDLTAVEKSSRSVHTASALQVRQGIYTGSSEAWRRYEPWLGEILDGLGDFRSPS